MLAAMSNTLFHATNRLRRAPGPDPAAWRWIGLWAGLAALMGLVAATIEPIGDLGRGAAVFAGVGAACAVALALGASMHGFAAAMAAWRRFRPLPEPVSAVPVPAAAGGDPIIAELVGGLAAQVARLDEKLKAVGTAARDPAAPAGEVPTKDRLAPAVERLEQAQRAALARMAAGAEEAEGRCKARVDALGRAVLPRVDGLGEDLAHLRRSLADTEARLDDFERQVFDIFRARDVGKVLRTLDDEASELFEKLFDGDERRYGTAEAWRGDYAEWRSRINRFWDVLRGYRTGVEQPFSVSEADVDRTGGVPDSALFATEDMRFRYKMLVVVNERHTSFKQDAFSFNAKKGSPPDQDAPPAPRSRLARSAAG
jgi:hypothetical protein